MLMSRYALNTCRNTTEKQIYTAFCMGMAINLASIYIGNPYIISLLTIPIAAVMTFKWLNQPLPWIVLVSAIAANPVNLNAPIALNLIFAIFLLMLSMHYLSELSSWLYLILFLAFLSIIGSVADWSTTGEFFTQFAAIGNYVIGPFFLLPLIYFRLQKEVNADLLLKAFVFSLIVPSVTFMFLARLFGTHVVDANTSAFESLVNVSIYHLGNIDFQLTRTQAGIPLAVLICASFAVIVSAISKKIRLIAFVSLIVTTFLLLVTGSVGSSLAALCGIMLLLGIARRYISIKRYFIVLPIVIGLAMAGWSQLPQGIKDYAYSRYEEKLSGGIDTSDRSGRWQLSLTYLMDNPLGRGWDLYVAPIGTYPHNDYLSYGIAFGFVCSLLYLFVPAKILLSIVSVKVHIKDPARVAILLASAGSVTVFLINSFSDHLTANRWYFNVVWSIIWYGYFASKSLIAQDEVGHSFQGTAP
jgi:O-antigen ligase/polysaccharide polymerase Wzy-like membrane protein